MRPSAASSPEPAPTGTEKPWENQPPERRYGFTAGIAGGVMLGSSAGYPNDALKIGYERYYTETGVGIGGGGSAWIGAALTDWLVFGLGGGLSGMIAGDASTSTYSFMFHTDVFPVYWLGGVWRDIGVNLDTGFALSSTTPSGEETTLIDGGGSSRIAFGAFYEGVRLWKLSMGPWAYIDYTWSSSVRQPGFYLGWRTALYTKP
ncbi:hypothetical protein [Chondromyces apiculatus]|uniref:Outer membrane protein beta-barrel domain-containing protein n=1 Tax=Chondromyces apiculatus DSM 436 TaxID=1192034 RepID=A0A017TCK7_9BACT|nr:hypothetical protein [Chondromyces apiculatus]EYF06366.1 Hypothetical protein CAP_1896 [Chondromyces apiculatus DSM 436]